MNNKQMEMMAREHDMSAMDAEFAAEVADAAAKGAVGTYQKIEKAVVGGYKKIEDGVVGGYKKIENGAVEGFGKVVDKCVEVLFAKEGETVEDAKKRLNHKEEK
jgi:hypothetical protein